MKKKLNISASENNDLVAAKNREFLTKKGIFTLNIIGSPGCGKTSILEYTAKYFKGNFAVIVGDVKTALDSDRIIQEGHPFAYAIETGGGCHLTASMIRLKIKEISLENINYLFIENVGNLVCPSSFELGENIKVAVLSIPEGDEKVRKYPALFLRASAVIINKIDLLEIMDYDIERVKNDCLIHNPEIKIFSTSTKTGQGFSEWFKFLREQNP